MKHTPASIIRIIGGTLKSRKITFYAEAGLRPTHNRIRETVFNWLAPVIENSTCLDAFAGSGALGFEAISRGAKEVVFCDTSLSVIAQLKKNAETLKITNAEFLLSDFILENKTQNKKFDVVFLDPPFQKNILLSACVLLESKKLLNPGAQIYLEYPKNTVDLTLLPKNWVVRKNKSTQTISYVLLEAQNTSHSF